MELSRAEFLKVSGTAVATALFGGSLVGCSKKNKEVAEQEEVIEVKKPVVSEDGLWTETGETRYFNPGEHSIWEIVNYDYDSEREYFYIYESNGQIPTYEGYQLFSTEPIIERSGYGSRSQGSKYNFINTEPVEAKVYVDEYGTTSCPFPGTVVQLKNDKSKVKSM